MLPGLQIVLRFAIFLVAKVYCFTCLSAAMIHIGWSDIVQSFVVALAVVVINEAGHRLSAGLGTVIDEQVHLGLSHTEDNVP